MKRKLIHSWLLATTVLLIGAASFSAQAQSSASGSLQLSSVSVSPLAGTISGWTGWTLGAVSTSLNSDGAFSQNFDFEFPPPITTATASSSVPYASASDTATALSTDASSLSGQASGSVLIPRGLNESASVSGGSGNFSSFDAQFTLSQSTTVTFGAIIAAAQAMQTDAGGQVLEDEVTFNLNVDGSSVLVYDNALTLGPSGFLSTSASPTLSSGISLTSGSHDLYIELDDEQEVLEMPAPDGGRTVLLLLAALGSLAAVGAGCGTRP